MSRRIYSFIPGRSRSECKPDQNLFPRSGVGSITPTSARRARTRLDGRKLDEIRQISAETGYLPGPHGSALFTRGETQSLTTVTLGTKVDEQIVDQTMYQGYSKFLLHYNFPGFSTGEVKPNRGAGRREIGHGNLAHRSLKKGITTRVRRKSIHNSYRI
jgi:polyribonucleotide nucleotidyltransferase